MTGAERIAEKASTHRNITEERAIYTMVDRSQVHVGYERSPSGRLSVKSVEALLGE